MYVCNSIDRTWQYLCLSVSLYGFHSTVFPSVHGFIRHLWAISSSRNDGIQGRKVGTPCTGRREIIRSGTKTEKERRKKPGNFLYLSR